MSHTPLTSSPHPLPPTTEGERALWLRLLRSRRVGIATFYRLLQEHGSAEAALAALPSIAAAAGVDSYEICPESVVRAELNAARKLGAVMLCIGDPAYPRQLIDLPDAPPILWALGDLSLLTRPMISLVGARNASSLGLRMARKLGQELAAANYVVVSGLARGIDTAAHEGAMDHGTIAVIGGGLDTFYPPENTELQKRIAQSGLLLSETPMGMQATARHFPARNRIIAALSSAIVVTEAAAKSGSLITARNALDLGREVLAVPGHPMDARAAGCNMLLRDGATLIRHAEDVIEALGPLHTPDLPLQEPPAPPPSPPKDKRSRKETFALHKLILNRLGPAPLAEDQLIRDVKAKASEVAPALLDLELDGQIERQTGGLLSRRA